MRSVLVGCVLLAGVGCTLISGEKPELTQERWASRTSIELTGGLVLDQGNAVLFMSPRDGSDIYTSALAAQALASADALDIEDWETFAARVEREVEDDGLADSIAGTSSTALELTIAARISGHTLVSRSFEQALRETTPPEPGDDLDPYDGIAAIALALQGQSEVSALREAVRASLRSLIETNGCAATETLFALGAAATIDERVKRCTDQQVRILVAHQLKDAASNLAKRPALAGLPHAEVVLAAARLVRAGVSVDRKAVVDVGKSVLAILSRNRDLGTAVAAGAVAQAFTTIDQPVPLSAGLVELLRRTVVAGGEPSSVVLQSTARALLARIMRLLGHEAPQGLLVGQTELDAAERVESAMANGDAPAVPTVVALIQDIRAHGSGASAGASQARVTVLLRAVNRIGSSTCSLPELRRIVDEQRGLTSAQPLDQALRLRWNRLCGRPNPRAEKLLLQRTSDGHPRGDRMPTTEDLLRAWQSGAARCALAPERLDPDAEWSAFRVLTEPHGGVPAEDGMSLDLTATFALASLTTSPSRACRSGTFG